MPAARVTSAKEISAVEVAVVDFGFCGGGPATPQVGTRKAAIRMIRRTRGITGFGRWPCLRFAVALFSARQSAAVPVLLRQDCRFFRGRVPVGNAGWDRWD